MKRFYTVNGLMRLMLEHPEYVSSTGEWDAEKEMYTATVQRRGKDAVTIRLTLSFAKVKAKKNKVWGVYPVQMLKAAAMREAIEQAFPEFKI